MSSTSSFFPSLFGFTSFTLKMILKYPLKEVEVPPHTLSLFFQFSQDSALCLVLQPKIQPSSHFFSTILLDFGELFQDLFFFLKIVENFWQILRDSLCFSDRLFQASCKKGKLNILILDFQLPAHHHELEVLFQSEIPKLHTICCRLSFYLRVGQFVCSLQEF